MRVSRPTRRQSWRRWAEIEKEFLIAPGANPVYNGNRNRGVSYGRYKMKDSNCAYCSGGALLAKFGIPICDLDVSQLILFKEQSKPGRCIVAYKDHVSEIVDISEEERNRFLSDITRAAKAIHGAFHPDKLNYGAYGDTGCHLHMHLVPKYKDQDEWGGVFQMNPDKTYLSEDGYAEMIAKIKECLE